MELNTEIKQKEKFTYLIFDGQKYKIGKSNNPEKRLKSIKTGNPDAILLGKTDKVTETFLHNYFCEKRLKGEWFKLEDKDIEKLNEIFEFGTTWKDRVTEGFRKGKETAYKKYEKYVFNFGKYNGRKLITMTSEEEISYIVWLVEQMSERLSNRQKKSYIKYRALKWWLYTFTHHQQDSLE